MLKGYLLRKGQFSKCLLRYLIRWSYQSLCYPIEVLFQALCTEPMDWDAPLKGNTLKQWNHLMAEARALSQIQIPCCYFSSNSSPTEVQLHGFSDASEQAFAAAVYLRAVYPDGTITTRLVAAKTRVAPIKKESIPRLELLGALILARVANTIVTAMARSVGVVYWVDSMTTLFWIKGEGETMERVCC